VKKLQNLDLHFLPKGRKCKSSPASATKTDTAVDTIVSTAVSLFY